MGLGMHIGACDDESAATSATGRCLGPPWLAWSFKMLRGLHAV